MEADGLFISFFQKSCLGNSPSSFDPIYLIESREIKPLIAARYSLEDAAEAHKLMESSKHIGKIILTVAE